jgi:hypothetical protein
MKRQALVVVLDPGRVALIEQGAGDRDDAAREEALVELPVAPADRHGGVAADSPALADGERDAQHVIGDSVSAAIGFGGDWPKVFPDALNA